MEKFWQTARRKLNYKKKTLVMAILNMTPDSFSDGGKFFSVDKALHQAENFIDGGADIIDIGGESTRPTSQQVSITEEIKRVVPIIEAITKRFDVAISIDTSKSVVAEKAVEAGAEIINDISGLKFDEQIALVAAKYQTGLILMHLRGTFETMHKLKPAENILQEIAKDFCASISKANDVGVKTKNLALDVGIGFSKTFDQNLEILAKLGEIIKEFPDYPMLVGTSRKSFLGKISGKNSAGERLNESLASAAVAVWNGANIVRVHDVKETVEAIKVVDSIKFWKKNDV